ncbi:MAG TPA: acylphosphatase [Anaerolineales bacterium]|nr:acylphosphatase [Anaerolineales bacterium]
MVKRHILVTGRVQGVGFRAFTQAQAVKFRIAGWVRNLGYNQVEIEAEGDLELMTKFLELIKLGPTNSRVDHLEVEDLSISIPANSFEVRASR